MTLELNSIEVTCIIGDLDFERTKEQTILLDVSLEIDDVASQTDRIEDAVDYVILTQKLREALIDAKCRLIERAARIACFTCAKFEHVKSATVKVRKFGCVEGVGFSSATYSMPC